MSGNFISLRFLGRDQPIPDAAYASPEVCSIRSRHASRSGLGMVAAEYTAGLVASFCGGFGGVVWLFIEFSGVFSLAVDSDIVAAVFVDVDVVVAVPSGEMYCEINWSIGRALVRSTSGRPLGC